MNKQEGQNIRGSEWRKWDLHVHTPLSFCQNYGGNTKEVWEKFITDLEMLPKEFAAIGINDYLFLDGYEKVLVYKNSGRLKNIDLILPVLEFRLNEFSGVDFGEYKRPNIHVIFADASILDPDIIKSQFLATLNAKYIIEKDGKGFRRVLNRSTIKTLGKQIIDSVPDREKAKFNSPEIEGFNQLNLTFDQIKQSLNNDCLDGKYLLGIGKTEWDQMRWSDSCVASKKTLINSCQVVFTSSHSIDDFNKARKKLKDQNVNDLLLDCSDAHNFSGSIDKNGNLIKDRIGKCFSWIKAELSFEGLKQVVCDPNERIKIQERNPVDSKSKRTIIDKVSFNNSTGEQREVYFNQDLNSIIGSRGSGKSTLLKNIARKIDINQFDDRDKKPPYSLTNFKVFWSDNGTNSGDDKSPKSVFYIPQGYLSALTYNDGEREKERDKFLTDLLKKNSQFSNADDQFNNFISHNELSIEDSIKKLLLANDESVKAQSSIKKQGSKNEVTDEIKEKESELKKFKQSTGIQLKDKEVIEYSEICNSLEKNIINKNLLSQDKDILTKFKSGDDSNVSFYNEKLEKLSLIRRSYIEKILTEESKEKLKEIITEELNKIDRDIKETKGLIEKEQKRAGELKEKIDKSKALTDLAKELSDLKKTVKNIEELETQIQQTKIEKDSALKNLVDYYISTKNKRAKFYESVDFGTDFSFLQIGIQTKYDLEDLKNFMVTNINTVSTLKRVQDNKDIKHLFSDSPKELTKETVKEFITKLITGEIKIKVGAGEISEVISRFLKNRYSIDYLNSVKTHDGKTTFENMTGGEKSIALLELIFKYDDEKYPILIDQPEDDLDVTGIATNLVNFVKKEKEQRQIILVTHNASLAICSDTENIVVAESSKLKDQLIDFEYKSGGIENTKMRNDIIRILEGGEKALTLRMMKLSIKL